MSDIKFSYKIDLIVHLVDTTTGFPVSQKNVKFFRNGRMITFLEKTEGFHILINNGREDMEIEAEVSGYMPAKAQVCYGELNQAFPEIEIPLIPIPKPYGYFGFITLEGLLPEIESVDAIALDSECARVAGYIDKKQVLKLFVAKYMEEQAYAIVHEEQMEFEEFCISKKIDRLTLKLKNPLKMACRPEQTVTRIIRGIAYESGKYLLRVQENSSTDYLIRYVVKGKTKYKRIDISNPEDRRLE